MYFLWPISAAAKYTQEFAGAWPGMVRRCMNATTVWRVTVFKRADVNSFSLVGFKDKEEMSCLFATKKV